MTYSIKYKKKLIHKMSMIKTKNDRKYMVSSERPCHGDCFEQDFETDADGYAYKKDPKKKCQLGCKLWKCRNFDVCGHLAPAWMLDANSGYCIFTCDVKDCCPTCKRPFETRTKT